MESGAPIGEKRRGIRRWQRITLGLIALPVLLFLLGNLLLSSRWTCRWAASQIEHRTGLETLVGGVSWTPWDGASLRSLELRQPPALRAAVKQPLIHIAKVRVVPVWRAWLRGRFEVRSIELDTPRIVLPLELISQLARTAPQVPAATASPVPPSPQPPPAVAQPGPPVTTPPPVVAPAPPQPAAPSQPTGWLRLKNASITVLLAGSHRPLLEISNASGAIPIAGDTARSNVTIGLISALGNPVTRDLTTSIEWTHPLLSLKPVETKIGGYHITVAGKIGNFSGLPLQIEAQLPRQALAPFALPFHGQASAEAVAANGRFRGLLLAPGTWQGDLIAESIAPTVKFASHEAKFDRGSAVTVLRGGVLSCVDARLISDELSLLGNATVLADGRAAGVARLVGAPETVSAIVGQISPNAPGPRTLTPLNTPQRAAFDLEAFGNISHLFVRLGKDGPILNLNP